MVEETGVDYETVLEVARELAKDSEHILDLRDEHEFSLYLEGFKRSSVEFNNETSGNIDLEDELYPDFLEKNK